ncbi:MAG: hypothetical protein H5T85_04395 [Actinobacteria bacterium]|nr:hypothetical protein [Actinomycetota bacterium]
MERVKEFFTSENFKENLRVIWEKIYSWLADVLDKLFGRITYEPIRELLTNPWFWIILLGLFILGRIFRRR